MNNPNLLAPSTNTNDSIPLDPLWKNQIANNVNSDQKNETLVMSFLVEMIENPYKMSSFIDGVFAKLNAKKNELDPLQFKEFFDLT